MACTSAPTREGEHMSDKCYWLFERNGKVTVRWSPWVLVALMSVNVVVAFACGVALGLLL
jgi:hypothetical protein